MISLGTNSVSENSLTSRFVDAILAYSTVVITITIC